jgi:hypothetical protein
MLQNFMKSKKSLEVIIPKKNFEFAITWDKKTIEMAYPANLLM